MSLYIMTPFLGPAIGAVVGGYVASSKGWRWTMWILLILTGTLAVPGAVGMRETYKKAILKRRARKAGRKVVGPHASLGSAAGYFFRTTLARPLHMVVVEPVVACFTLYVALNIGMLYGFFSAFPWVFETQYGFSLGEVGLSFLGLGAGVAAATVIIIVWQKAVYAPLVARTIAQGGTMTPESRLTLAMIGSVLIPTALFLFGWTAEYRVFWMVPIIAEALFGCGNV